MTFLEDLGATAKGVAKILLLSRLRGAGCRRKPASGRIFVLGNGPSLRGALDAFATELAHEKTLAVNFALNTPEIRALAPEHYVLADPHFFRPAGEDASVDALWGNIAGLHSPMTLFVPVKYLTTASKRIEGAPVTLRPFNAVGVEGFPWFAHAAYRSGLGMPRPRNVLIPSIMLAIRAGFSEIVLLGADHSWMTTLAVNDDNEVVSIQPHFYKEDAREEKRVRHEYRGYRLYQIVGSFAVAFRAYHLIERFARAEGVRIINATPGSFIDSFRRAPLRTLL